MKDTGIYIYDMPFSIRQDLCNKINRSGCLKSLADQMGYTLEDVDIIKLQKDPAEDLLSMWENQNHTVTELFVVLYRIEHYLAMECMRNLVDQRFHHLILKVQPDVVELLSEQSISRGLIPEIINGQQSCLDNNESESNADTKEKPENSNEQHVFDKMNEISSIPKISYKELELATENWSPSNVLGKGGFATVFRGNWKCTDVAIKRIEYRADKTAIIQSHTELKILTSCRHDNILPLYGYSTDGQPCLVYQIMKGGSLQSRLWPKKDPLDLKQRLNIAMGTARGLQYLHTFSTTPLIHGDIKPANILLDKNDQPKIGDFGLAREGVLNSQLEVSRVYGTRPYLPAEFLQYNALSTKVDVYSFGVVLFELATGLRAYDEKRGKGRAFLTKYVGLCRQNLKEYQTLTDELIDKHFVRSEFINLLFLHTIRLGLSCTSDNPKQRPEMVRVLHYLQQIVNIFGPQ